MVLKAKPAADKAAAPAAAATTTKKFEAMEGGDTAVLEQPEGSQPQAGDTDTGDTDTGGTVAGAVMGSNTEPGDEAAAAKEMREATKAAALKAAEDAKPNLKPKAEPAEGSMAESAERSVATAPAAGGAVAVSKKYVGALSALENAIDPSGLDFNTFPRVTVGLDGFSVDDGRDLGKTIAMEVMSYNDRWVASPGDDSDESKKLVRYSLDGKHIDAPGTDDHGRDLVDYVNELKEVHGLTDAAVKKYQAVYGFMTYANDAEIDEVEREIIALQVPPQSRALFTRHQITHGVKIQRKLVEDSPMLWCRQEKKQGQGTKKYALIHFASK